MTHSVVALLVLHLVVKSWRLRGVLVRSKPGKTS